MPPGTCPPELVVLLDEQGRAIGTAPKATARTASAGLPLPSYQRWDPESEICPVYLARTSGSPIPTQARPTSTPGPTEPASGVA